MNRSHGPLLAALLAMLGGCATTEVETFSVVRPDLGDRHFAAVCVTVPDGDLGARREIETRIADALTARGVRALRWTELFFPGESYPDEEIVARLEANGVEAVLSFETTHAWTEEFRVPETATMFVDGYGGGRPWRRLHGFGFATTTVYGGYTVALPRALYESRLVDRESGLALWIATIRAKGQNGADWDAVRRAAADEVVPRLVRDGLLAVGPLAAELSAGPPRTAPATP
ncbi:MAG: hypothetical protein IPM29_18315 [Planctomycetes bacterium]|nr:hypothetical protein [Planctomycetota bacterium]